MTRKKILLVIVEGPSDETALGYALSQVYDREQVYIHVVHGDITTKDSASSSNIVNMVGNQVKIFLDNNPFKPSDFKGIIHIVDMDGAFVPDEVIHEDSGCERSSYSDTEIRTDSVERIIKRNAQKRETLFRLIGTGKVRSIPYRIYYMSCNTDHVLYDKRDSTDEEKENDAYDFAAKYKGDVEGFLHFMCESDFSVDGEYKDSWKYIQTGLHSLERHSNLSVCLRVSAKKTGG
ncbi:MAG: hypothetical protein K6F86_09110 [Lachnospiraceae bacterium]|nr:hypothetical protein [Lachnospiraceae bacterium]